VINPPSDHTLRGLWDGIIESELSQKILHKNKALFTAVLTEAGLYYDSISLADNNPAESKTDTSIETVKHGGTVATSMTARSLAQLDEVLAVEVFDKGEQIQEMVALAVKLQAARTNVLSERYGYLGTMLSPWALDAAVTTVSKSPSLLQLKRQTQQGSDGSTALGVSTRNSKEELNQLITDKHEKALLANVLTPQVRM
jgi:hypothetical protein